jgi:hypothetical protein
VRQAHSCQVVPLSAHLDKATPAAKKIYDAVMKAVKACGPVQVAPTKTGINLLSGSSLGSVKFGKSHVDVGLLFTHAVDHARLKLLYRLSARSFAYRLRVNSPNEVDADARKWIRMAYDAGRLAGRRPRE